LMGDWSFKKQVLRIKTPYNLKKLHQTSDTNPDTLQEFLVFQCTKPQRLRNAFNLFKIDVKFNRQFLKLSLPKMTNRSNLPSLKLPPRSHANFQLPETSLIFSHIHYLRTMICSGIKQ
jgi:hypothetical protein